MHQGCGSTAHKGSHRIDVGSIQPIGQLLVFVWSGRLVLGRIEDGGLYRVSPAGPLPPMPLEVRAVSDGLVLTFSQPLEPGTAVDRWDVGPGTTFGPNDTGRLDHACR